MSNPVVPEDAAATAAAQSDTELHPFGPAVARLDEGVDAFYERWRGQRGPDAVFGFASRAGEFSLGWQVAGLVANLAELVAGRPQRAVRFAALIGLESLLVNQGIKRLFSRPRPVHVGEPERLGVRRPVTSSFPSGHASSAFFAATLLSEGHPRRAPAWFALAAVVAASRPYAKVHHTSDVLAGAATGLALAATARRLWPRP